MQRSCIWGKKIPLVWRGVCPCKAWKYRCWGICICANSSWTIVHQEEILFQLLIRQKDCYPSLQPKKEKMGKLSARYSPKLYFSQGGAFLAKSNFFLYNWISRHTRSLENQKQAISKPGFLVYKNFIKATRNPVLQVCWGEHQHQRVHSLLIKWCTSSCLIVRVYRPASASL